MVAVNIIVFFLFDFMPIVSLFLLQIAVNFTLHQVLEHMQCYAIKKRCIFLLFFFKLLVLFILLLFSRHHRHVRAVDFFFCSVFLRHCSLSFVSHRWPNRLYILAYFVSLNSPYDSSLLACCSYRWFIQIERSWKSAYLIGVHLSRNGRSGHVKPNEFWCQNGNRRPQHEIAHSISHRWPIGKRNRMAYKKTQAWDNIIYCVQCVFDCNILIVTLIKIKKIDWKYVWEVLVNTLFILSYKLFIK